MHQRQRAQRQPFGLAEVVGDLVHAAAQRGGGVHDQLGLPGRPGGAQEHRRLARVRALRPRPARRPGTVGQQRAPRLGAGCVIAAARGVRGAWHDEAPQRPAVGGRHTGQHPCCGRVGQVDARSQPAQDRGELGRGPPRVQRAGDRPEAEAGVVGGHQLQPVGHHHADAVARSDTFAGQPAGHAQRLISELRVGPGLLLGGDRHLTGTVGGLPVEILQRHHGTTPLTTLGPSRGSPGGSPEGCRAYVRSG